MVIKDLVCWRYVGEIKYVGEWRVMLPYGLIGTYGDERYWYVDEHVVDDVVRMLNMWL